MESDTTYSFRLKDSLLGAQMLFVAFGALVLVPILTGMSTNVALFTAGVGTLIFQICTRGKVPVFLASSFAFIAPIIYGVQTWGLPATLGGMVVAGAVYVVLSFIIRWRGTEIIMRLLPPIVTGPVIIVIGLVLAPVGVNMALGKAGDGSAVLVPENTALIISMAALATTVLVSLLGRGMIRLIPIMSGIAVGYLCAIGLGIHDFSKVAAAPWFGVPDFVFPEFRWEAILFIIPITLAPAIEHFGDIIAISSVTGKDFLKDPGIKSTMLGELHRRASEYDLFGSDRGGGPDPGVQPRRHDVGRHLGHRALVRQQARRVLEFHPRPGHGRDHDPALRGHHGGGPEHAGPRWRRLDGAPQPRRRRADHHLRRGRHDL